MGAERCRGLAAQVLGAYSGQSVASNSAGKRLSPAKLASPVGASALVFRNVMDDALARQIGRQRFAPALAWHCWRGVRQAGVGQRHGLLLRFRSHLLGFVKHPLATLLATGSVTLELRQPELLFQLAHARRQLRIARLEIADVGLLVTLRRLTPNHQAYHPGWDAQSTPICTIMAAVVRLLADAPERN